MGAHRHHRSPALLLGLLTLLLAPAAVSCTASGGTVPTTGAGGGLPTGAVSPQWIGAQSLAHLYYPGSHVFFVLDAGSAETAGSDAAYAGAVLTSAATGAQIYSWYEQKLAQLGWSFVTDNGCVDGQPTCPQFGHRGHGTRETFYLAIDNPTLLPVLIGRTPAAACTVYEIRYELFPPGGIRVPAPMTWNGGNECWWTGHGWHKPADVP